MFFPPLSIELRELEKKLKSAYLNKERAAQIAEKEAMQYEKMVIPAAPPWGASQPSPVCSGARPQLKAHPAVVVRAAARQAARWDAAVISVFL